MSTYFLSDKKDGGEIKIPITHITELIINEISHIGSPDTPEGRTYRIGELVPHLKQYGNFVEIGAGTGHTTVKLLQRGNKVLVIDPWQSDEQQPPGYGVYSYDDFKERTKGYNNLVVAKMPSFFKEVEVYLRDITPIAFALVDGLQYKENVLSDLFLMAAFGAKVICVDDINRSTPISQVPEAVEKFLEGNKNYKRVTTREDLIECYLIKI